MITWIHKMAPGWRHGWVIMLKSLMCRFLIRAKILWKFKNHSHRNSWDNRATNLYINPGKRRIRIRTDTIGDMYVHTYHLTRGNLSCWQIKVICFIFWYENLTTFPTSDWKLEITFPIAHSLSYNILNLGRKWSHNNRDTAQRSLPCRFMFGKKWPPIDITRKYDKLCIFAFNR